jgi:hypothetical protein
VNEQTKLERLAEYYDTHDTSTELERAEPVDEWANPDPMVSLSLRLPKSLLDWVCTQARTEHTKPTQLIRRWIEEHRTTGEPSARGPSPTRGWERVLTGPGYWGTAASSGYGFVVWVWISGRCRAGRLARWWRGR